jgi:hypothetical protein
VLWFQRDVSVNPRGTIPNSPVDEWILKVFWEADEIGGTIDHHQVVVRQMRLRISTYAIMGIA